jgi:hypothetical protein
VVELDGRHVVDQVGIPGIEHHDLRRHELAVHQWKSVVGKSGANPGNESAGEHHHEHHRGKRGGGERAAAHVIGDRRRRPQKR